MNIKNYVKVRNAIKEIEKQKRILKLLDMEVDVNYHMDKEEVNMILEDTNYLAFGDKYQRELYEFITDRYNKGQKGFEISTEELKVIFNSNITANKCFYKRYIKDPSLLINNNKKLKLCVIVIYENTDDGIVCFDICEKR